MQVIAQLLRCHHTGKRHTINQRLIEVLYATARTIKMPSCLSLLVIVRRRLRSKRAIRAALTNEA